MLRGGSALVTVFVCFACVSALPPPCTHDLIARVDLLLDRNRDKQWLDCSLYTPTAQDFQKCPVTTLKCFAEEFKVLVEEWRVIEPELKLSLKLQKLTRSITETESDCRQCELLREENAKTFLTDLRSTLTGMNSRYCPLPRRALPKDS